MKNLPAWMENWMNGPCDRGPSEEWLQPHGHLCPCCRHRFNILSHGSCWHNWLVKPDFKINTLVFRAIPPCDTIFLLDPTDNFFFFFLLTYPWFCSLSGQDIISFPFLINAISLYLTLFLSAEGLSCQVQLISMILEGPRLYLFRT